MKLIILLMLSAAILPACVAQQPTNQTVVVSFGSVELEAEIADSPEEWSRGLMFRESLGQDKGMLFIFPDSRQRSFWMKNTLIPLDIIFVSESFEIVSIKQAEPCKQDPCRYYLSEKPAKYVVEANKGFAEMNNVRKGDSIGIGA